MHGKDMLYCSVCGQEYDRIGHDPATVTSDGTGCVRCNPDKRHREYLDPLAHDLWEARYGKQLKHSQGE